MAKKYMNATINIVRISNNVIATSSDQFGDKPLNENDDRTGYGDGSAFGAPTRRGRYDAEYDIY